MIFDPTSSDLNVIWKTFKDFEGFARKPDRDISHFIEEWKERMAKVQSAGCQYSDLLLGLKLMEKVNLSDDSIVSVISKLSSSTFVSESFLTQVVSNIKEQSEINGSSTANQSEELANTVKTNEDDQNILEELESKTNLISCSKCPLKLFDLESLSKHFHEFHPDMTNTKVINSKMGTRSDSGFLKCPICDKNFMMLENLKKHLSKHDSTFFGSGDKSLVEQTWFDSSEVDTVNQMDATTLTPDVKINIKTEAGTEPESKTGKTFKCTVCSKGFSKLWKVTEHMRVHSTTKDYKCPYCDITYKWKSGLRKHLLHMHLEEQREQKLLTANATQRGSQNQTHDDTTLESGHDSFAEQGGVDSGEVDGVNQMDATALTPDGKIKIKTENNAKSIGKGGKTFKCTICSKGFSKLWKVTEHMRVHSTTKDYKCPICDNTYKWKSGLKKHLLIMHLDDQGERKSHKLPCEICGKSISMFNLKTHIRKAHAAKIDKFDDSEEFSKLSPHEKSMKTHSKIHQCSICQKILTTAHVLKLHMETHKTTKDYICSYCGKKYKTLNVLKEHLNLHTKARTLPCEYCGKTFLAYAGRAFHIRKHHTGEKPFKCDFCDRRFINQGRKTYHMRTHTGEKPFSCRECGKCFIEPGSLQRHLKNVHKIVNSSSK